MSYLLLGNEGIEESIKWEPPAKPAERPLPPGYEHMVGKPFDDYFIRTKEVRNAPDPTDG